MTFPISLYDISYVIISMVGHKESICTHMQSEEHNFSGASTFSIISQRFYVRVVVPLMPYHYPIQV